MQFQTLTDEDLKHIANGILNGTIFTDRHLDENDSIGSHCLPIGLGSFGTKTEEEIRQIGMAYEYMQYAGPRSVNGKPSFMSVRYLSIAQLEKVIDYMQKIEKSFEAIT